MKDLAIKIIEKLKETTQKQVIRIETVEKENLGIKESKFAGLPYLPKNKSIPVSNNSGEKLKLLAQINCEELPKNDFYIKKGILQFWINPTDDLNGADFDNLSNQNDFRIVYYENVDEDYYSEEELEALCQIETDEDIYFPIEKAFGLNFTLDNDIMSECNEAYLDLFVKIYNDLCPDKKIDSYYDLDDELLEELNELNDSSGHKLGGYPFFTQWDPRDENEYQEILLQIDSENKASNWDIIWGDAGVANFFIDKKNLDNKDFTDVAYTWDCS